MNDTRGLATELDIISVERTSLIVAPKHEEPKQITGREYRRMLRKWAFACGVEFGIIIAMSLIIYILQAGHI